MKASSSLRLGLPGALVLAAVACQQTTSSTTANLNGAQAALLVDQLGEGVLAARSANPDGGPWLVTGVPNRYVFMTSSATNELRVLENFRDGLTGRGFLRAPNPLETLSIPVLDRPTLLATDEARNADGQRVTGPYVYAGRPGSAEVSVISVARRRQLSGKPFPVPAPLTDLAAWMDVDTSVPAIETPIPTSTRLFVSTWDGEVSSVWTVTLATDSPELERLEFKRALLVDGLPIVALAAVPPRANRTLDGAPFCERRGCLALALREDGGRAGQTLLLDPESGRTAKLDFGGPVRELVHSESQPRLFALLDEQACGGPSCGGVLAVDLLTGVSPAGFPRSRDATGTLMAPLRSDGLITGLALAADVILQQAQETASTDGGTSSGIEYLKQRYDELGAFGSSNGVITFFSALSSSIIDFDGRRAVVSGAGQRLPGTLEDGGVSFTGEDGGVLGTSLPATVSTSGSLDEPWRTTQVVTADGATWLVELSDGYWESQSFVVIHQGQLPGLVSLPTSAADGTRLRVAGGFEARAAVGDIVRFEAGNGTDGYVECGRTRVTAIGAGTLDVAEAPAACTARVRFSVRADGGKPLVVAADLEGYMGRAGAGETLTYNRPYVLLPAGVTAPRTSFTLVIPPTVSRLEGAYVSFTITDHLVPYRVGVDASNLANGSCFSGSASQTVFGPMAMALVPNSVANSAEVNFQTALFTTVPSGNGVVELAPFLIPRVGVLTRNDGASCWR